MAQKKTNFIAFELEKMEKYLASVISYLDSNPIEVMEDRVEWLTTPKGGDTIKVIASKEAQIKCWTDRFKELPRILEDINRLRSTVNGETAAVESRGNVELPGLFKNKLLPNSTNKEDIEIVSSQIHEEIEYDDDENNNWGNFDDEDE